MNSMRLFLTSAVLITTSLSPVARADIELPRGSLAGCPFLHEDEYDLTPILEGLKAQLNARLEGKSRCLQSMQAIYSNLSSLDVFYKTIDPSMKQKLTSGIYSNAILELENRKGVLEATGKTADAEYSSTIAEISQLKSLNLENEIDLKYNSAFSSANLEARYRAQMLGYTSNLLNAYTATARTNPQCIDTLGGWNQALAALMGGFSVATGVGLNPTTAVLEASGIAALQLVNLLKDSKVRGSYNDLIRLKNYKNLACTYYAIQRSTCEYRRAYRISDRVNDIRAFYENRFDRSTGDPVRDQLQAEYKRYFVNLGRLNRMGEIFRGVAQMGSALTLNLSLLANYFVAKSVNFNRLGPAPQVTDPPNIIRKWLIDARAAGINYTEFTQTGGTAELSVQLKGAVDDVEAKKSTIEAVDKILLENKSFLDTRRYLSATFPGALEQVKEMRSYLSRVSRSPLISPEDKATVDAAATLLRKLDAFLSVVPNRIADDQPGGYESLVIQAGVDLFAELAKGAIAQLSTMQSAFALSEKGVDRLNWAFRVVQNAYLERDRKQALPADRSFIEFSKSDNILSKVIGDYNTYTGSETTFRSADYVTATSTFIDGFRQEMLKSLEMSEEGGIPELKGVTRAHLCALYTPSLRALAKKGRLGGGPRAARLLDECEREYKTLKTNKLVSDKDFTIDYADDCTYINYSRELEIQRLIAQLIRR